MEDVKMNKMGTKPIKGLIWSMGIPVIFAMIVQALYNIVDSFFVSRIPDTAEISGMGDIAMNALTLAFPIQMLITAVGVGTGVGVNALLSQSLGAGDRKSASIIEGNALFAAFCSYIVFLLFGLFGVRAYLQSQTSDPMIIEMGVEYLGICCVLSFGQELYMIYEKLLQATGKTLLATISQISGAVVNIILDPIMIFGLCGCPAMGVKGAAYATVIGQFVSFGMGAVCHHFFNKEVDGSLKYLKPNGRILIEIYKIGIPAIIMQALMSFMTYAVNIVFGRVSTSLVTAYGVYYKIQQFAYFSAFGLNNALIPIVGFNYGMGNKKRVKESIKYGIIDSVLMLGICGVIFVIFAEQIVSIFSLSEGTRALCITAMRIVSPIYAVAGANIALQGIFQALGKGVHSLIVSLLRLMVIVLPLAFLFTFMHGAETAVWFSFVIAESVALIIAIIFMVGMNKKIVRKLPDSAE